MGAYARWALICFTIRDCTTFLWGVGRLYEAGRLSNKYGIYTQARAGYEQHTAIKKNKFEMKRRSVIYQRSFGEIYLIDELILSINIKIRPDDYIYT